ncbi:MAG: tetratricopeptide repeat protein [Burkholderiales bacterium]
METLRKAMALHQAGDLEQAARCYAEILNAEPAQFDALHYLGLLEAQRERYETALSLLDRALHVDQRSVDALTNRANVLKALNRQVEALASCDRALAINPDSAMVHYNRGNILLDLARFEEALVSYDRVLAVMPENGSALYNRGSALLQLGRPEAALNDYDKLLVIMPNEPAALYNRGLALQKLGRYADALAGYNQALAVAPDDVEALTNRGLSLYELNRFTEALASYDKALAVDPGYVAAMNNRGNVLWELNRPQEALASFDKALALKSDFVEALHSKGNVLQSLHRHAEAAASYEQAFAIAPADDFVLCALAYAKMHLADWSMYSFQADRLAAAVRNGKSGVMPLVFLAVTDSAPDQLLCAQTWTRDKYPPSPNPRLKAERDRHDRIRIAYLSADLRDHAVSYLLAGLFETHDRARFEVTALAWGPPATGEMRTRLMGAFERFIDVGERSDAEVAALLRELEIDIAVDLAGFTTHSRAKIFASRPAPVQVSYVGFSATMGASYIDYIIADRYAIPEGRQACYAEKVVYLPDTFQANDSKRRIAERAPTRAEAGLPADGFVFCSFNNTFKITPRLFDIWMRLLGKVEGSVLWLLGSHDAVRRNLQHEAKERGIAPGRLIFATHAPYADHLARCQLADLFLDTLPFNAITTASDALWGGLPVLTCSGDAFAARAAGSLLHAVGLPELITHSLDEYEARALELAMDAQMLAAVRAKLARNRVAFPLFDTDRFRRNIEAAYITMWETAQRGEPPASFAVPAAG